jgi:hypothetical protein
MAEKQNPSQTGNADGDTGDSTQPPPIDPTTVQVSKRKKTSTVSRRTNKSLNKSALAAQAQAKDAPSGPNRDIWILVHVRRLETQGQYGHQTSTQILQSLLHHLNNGDKNSNTTFLPIDGTNSNPLKKGHKLPPQSLGSLHQAC